MYLWPTVAETAVCWKDRATATVDVGWLWCLPPQSCQLPGNTGSPSMSYTADRASSAHTFFHHDFSYSWFQHNGCLFLHWSCLHNLLKTTLVTTIYLSHFIFTSNVTYTYRNCSVKYNHLLEQMTVLSQQQNSQLFGIYNKYQNSYLNDGNSLYSGFK